MLDDTCQYHQETTGALNTHKGYFAGLYKFLGVFLTVLLMFCAWVSNSVVSTNKALSTYSAALTVQTEALADNIAELKACYADMAAKIGEHHADIAVIKGRLGR